ncbi:MAG: hypothetical protein ACFFCY_10830 [Promethearchaeota archaeon]
MSPRTMRHGMVRRPFRPPIRRNIWRTRRILWRTTRRFILGTSILLMISGT